MKCVAIWSGTGRKELLKITRGIFQFPLLDVKNFFFIQVKERGGEGSRGEGG